NEETTDKTYLSLSFVMDRATNKEKHLALDILTHILTDAQSSPLTKALLDANIGQDIRGYYDSSILQPVFGVIVKNTNAGEKDRFLKVFEQTLRELVENGFDEDLVEGAINFTEFKLKEGDHGSYPKGLIYNIELMESWLYGEKPELHLEYQEVIDTIRRESKNGYFEKLVEDYLLENTHSSLIILTPEKGLLAKREEKIARYLQNFKEEQSEEMLEKIIRQTEKLVQAQTAPDHPNDLDKIPTLPIEDIRKEHEKIPFESRTMKDLPVIFVKENTNGINYLDLYFDVGHIAFEEIPYLALFVNLLGEVSTEKKDYSTVNHEIEKRTGGIDFDLEIYNQINDHNVFSPKLSVKLRMLEEKTEDACALAKEILYETRLDEKQRLKEVLQSIRSKMEMEFMSAGHRVVMQRLMSYFSDPSCYLQEVSGIDFYQFVKDLLKHFDEKWEDAFEKIQNIANKIFYKEEILLAVTASEEGYRKIESHIDLFRSNLLEGKPSKQTFDFSKEKKNEGIATPGEVMYVGKAGNIKDLNLSYDGSMQVTKTILSTDYLWNNVRVQGGAYGAFFNIGKDGSLFIGSYRDPHLTRTLQVFNEAADYLAECTLTKEELNKYIIGTISQII
ncbi:MAG TPA: peptidase M16, partial [Eubacteriaceae bacterium]|nr:peptidase M16 [Eubacteriaceae bacterium]